MAALEELQERWRYLHQEYLPAMAAAKDPAQKQWTVHLDHCFARIVLDNAIGVDTAWTEKIKSPAIKNMTATQLQTAIDLAEKLATGEANLLELDQKSLQLRGKKEKKRKSDDTTSTSPNSKKLKKSMTVSSYFLPSPNSPSAKKEDKDDAPDDSMPKLPVKTDVDMSIQLKRIEESSITAFRKQTLSMLCQIPRGRYSTYGAMADWISKNSHKTCARAVGNAMRNNPFAPEVPCHRILAGDGSLGGFKGSWGEDGKYAKLKHDLLREEGSRFDSKGKVRGSPFRDFS
ncbi:hypothetical protein M409DRAFT_64076 [Zasmidium cellare ATCC 36951]|uniref:Methylated-DNA--protein-cysteine methyltransferase n=1 Tax=Zasmidium cellare ATCC 36951 TaxID=1080233 RepID=A0A6A6CVC0_ZASCE|nr:uncharacterized protein M409DRAFT_64076 [Zasmidium cellare ATCC 36951]KAF2171127.1 hypothetical protein M409DRAFT_64076 [Zasmidium cellare ATCC 36951]